MVPPIDDSELRQRICAGDDAAAAALDAKYRARLECIGRKGGVPAEDCRDLAQEVLGTAMVQIRTGAFRGESTVATWLNGILRIKVSDYWRRAQTNPLRMLEGSGDHRDLERGGLVAPDADPIVRISVQQAIAQLPPLHRIVLVMNQLAGATTSEIAARLGRPPGTVGRILAEAKEQFRRRLREDFGSNQRLLER